MSKAYGTVPVIEGQEIPAFGRKQGHSCCGGCCDMRRAVIVVNMISIAMYTINIFVISAVGKVEFDDDVMKEAIVEFPPVGWMVAIMFAEILCYAIGIWGAVSFSLWQVYVALGMYMITIIFNMIVFNFIALLMAGFFAYPHVYLIQEIKKGIMTKENYYSEEQSCCCV
jgi:hypothetical protein